MPLNSDGSYSVLHDHTLANINFSTNDSQANGDPTQIQIINGPTDGTLTQNSTHFQLYAQCSFLRGHGHCQRQREEFGDVDEFHNHDQCC